MKTPVHDVLGELPRDDQRAWDFEWDNRFDRNDGTLSGQGMDAHGSVRHDVFRAAS